MKIIKVHMQNNEPGWYDCICTSIKILQEKIKILPLKIKWIWGDQVPSAGRGPDQDQVHDD